MNIIKLQDMLRSVPDNALIGYVQNPQGEVPSYLALSELQRRKDTRAKYQQQQTPETSVAEDVTQEAQPGGLAMLAKNPDLSPGAPDSQGVASLPVDDSMYQEDSFAAGGIVAFEEGGDVKHYAKGDYVYSSDYDPVEQYRRARQLGVENVLSRKYGMPTTSVTKAGIETPYDAALNYYEGLRNQAAMSGKGLPELKSTTDALQKRREAWLAGSLDPYSQTSPVGSKPNIMGTQEPVVPATKPAGQPDVILSGEPGGKGQPGVSFDGTMYDKMLGKEKTLQELSDEYKAILGVDPTLAGRQEKLAKMEARAKRMEDMAPGMAMLEAGLGIAAGTSPFALANIGKGAMAGVKSYGEAQNKLAELEEKRFALDTELAKQQRAEQMAAITFGDRSRQHTEEMNKTVMLAKAKDKLTRDVANLEASTKSAGTNALKIKDVAEARAAYKNSEQQKKDAERIKKEYKLGDNADKETSPRHAEFKQYLRLAEEQYLADYFAPIGSNIPRASTQGFELSKPKK